MDIFSVAVDGPAGSGKSTIAKLIAKELNIVYIDTGAMYRAVALFCIKNGIDTKNKEAVCSVLDKINMTIRPEKAGQRIFLDNEDVTDEVRSQKAGAGASDVAAIGDVREKLVAIQRKMAEGMSVIMDGRDIGTNVLPNAPVKIYLSAGADERAKRRCSEFEKLGQKYDFQAVKEQIIQRDKNDMTRKLNPLRKADDAVEVDTTKMNIEEVKDTVIKIIKEKVGI